MFELWLVTALRHQYEENQRRGREQHRGEEIQALWIRTREIL